MRAAADTTGVSTAEYEERAVRADLDHDTPAPAMARTRRRA
jgi:hypothetical protein